MPIKRLSQMKKKKSSGKPGGYIADRVVAIRKELKLTQKDVSNLLGVTSQAIYAAERDNGSMIIEIIALFANNYNINPAYLITENNEGLSKIIERNAVSQRSIVPVEALPADSDQLATRIRRDVLKLKEMVLIEAKASKTVKKTK